MADEIGRPADPLTGEEAAAAQTPPAPARDLRPALALLEELRAAPRDFQLFAALRIIQASNPDLPRIGRSGRIDEDGARFGQLPSLAFQPSEIAAFAPRDDGGPMDLVTTVFGVFGPDGALPNHVTEEVVQESTAGRDSTTSDFVDLFHHRLIALLYRAWETTQIAVSRDRPGEDPYETWLNAVFGQAPAAFRDRDSLPDDLRRRLAGWFSSGPRNAAGLAAVAEEVIGAPVEIEEFIGEWLPIQPAERARFGASAMRLGADIVAGDRYYALQSRLRIRTDRLTIDRYRDLLPIGGLFPMLRDALRSFLGLAIAWELQPVLDAAEKPALRLGGEAPQPLGWTTWLVESDAQEGEDEGARPPALRDLDDLVLEGTLASAS